MTRDALIEMMAAARNITKDLLPRMTKEELLAFKAHYQELLNATTEALDKLEGVKWS